MITMSIATYAINSILLFVGGIVFTFVASLWVAEREGINIDKNFNLTKELMLTKRELASLEEDYQNALARLSVLILSMGGEVRIKQNVDEILQGKYLVTNVDSETDEVVLKVVGSDETNTATNN